MGTKHTWTNADGLTRYGGPRAPETDTQEKAVDKEIGKTDVADTIVLQDSVTLSIGCVWNGTWASRPAFGSYPQGTRIFVTDLPPGRGSVFVAGATMWLPESGEVTVGYSNIPGTAITGTTGTVTQDLVTIPGGLLGPNGVLVIEGTISCTTNANNKTLQLRLDSGGTPVRVFGATLNNIPAMSFQAFMWNRGAENSQSIHYNIPAGIGAGGTFEQTSLNTAVNQTLTFLTVLANAADTARIERWAVKARPF